MEIKIDTTCEHAKIRLIAAAIGMQQCTKTAGTEVQIPGTDKRILIGNDTYLAKVATPAAKGGITSLEGLTVYIPTNAGVMMDAETSIDDAGPSTVYLRYDDVERLLATTAAEQAESSGILAEVLALAKTGMSYGLLADDYCSQIVAKIEGASQAAPASPEQVRAEPVAWYDPVGRTFYPSRTSVEKYAQRPDKVRPLFAAPSAAAPAAPSHLNDTDKPTLADLARLFLDAYTSRKEVTLSRESCGKLYLAMTTPPEAASPASEQVAIPEGLQVEEAIGIVTTWNKGGSGEHNSIEPYQKFKRGERGYSLAASLPEGTLLYAAPAAPIAAAQVQEDMRRLRNRVSELEAARIAYASEFPLTTDGDPDVGNIHANIRKLKAQVQEEVREEVLSEKQKKVIESVIVGLRDGWAKRQDADAALAILGSIWADQQKGSDHE